MSKRKKYKKDLSKSTNKKNSITQSFIFMADFSIRFAGYINQISVNILGTDVAGMLSLFIFLFLFTYSYNKCRDSKK